MTQTLDTLYWQEQEQRAEELRSILERTFAVAQARGLIQPLDQKLELWGYQSQEHTLIYAPETDVFWVATNDGAWRVNWQGQEPISDINSEITSEQFREFQQLKQWLDRQQVPQEVSLTQTQQQAVQQWQQQQQDQLAANAQQTARLEAIAAVAERLFEHYASQGEAAYKLAPDSTEHIYRFAMDDRVYFISRDDATGTYNISKSGSEMNLRTGQGITQNDVQVWTTIGEWLTERERLIAEAQQAPSWSDTYWSQQEAKANQILPIAERAFAYQEARAAIRYDADRQSYITSGKTGEYEVGYAPVSDTFWVQRGDQVIVAATDHFHNYDRKAHTWQAAGLENIEQITEQDVQRFTELSAWLDVKNKQAGREPGDQVYSSQIQMNRSSIAASARAHQRDWVQQWQEAPASQRDAAFAAPSPNAEHHFER